MNNLIYLAGPYSFDPEAAFEIHMAYTAALLKREMLVFSPIVHNHTLAKVHNLPTDYTFWAAANRGMLLKSDELWVMAEPGWKDSKGTQYEISIAEEHYKPIKFIALKGDTFCIAAREWFE